MPVLGLSAAAFTTAATTATVATATTAAASAAASAALTATLTSIATNVAINIALSTALSLLQPNVGTAGRTFEWTLDPDGPIPFAAGRVGVAGSVVYRRTFGAELMYYGIPSVLSGAGPIDGYEGFMADDETVTFDATGKAITSQYKGELWYRNSFGSQPDTALVSPAGLKDNVKLIGWTAANRLSGKASYLIVMGENSKGTAYPTGEIKPLITLRGLKGWDPRLDSTYPGGSGPCRLHDPSTWVYITNPLLWALKWSLGLWEGPTGKGAPQVDYQVGGIGAKLSGIDVPAFVAAANVADANGWTVAAYPTTDDDKGQVLDAFLQAGGAIYAQRAGKISCIQRAAPRASIVTISAADTAGPLEIDTAASRIDRINTIRPRFWSEAHRWQMTALPEVTAAAYQTEDGGKRTRGLDLHYVSNATQAAQLAALQIANTREGIAGVIPLKPHLQRIRPGDAFTITEPGFVLNGLKCLCLNTDYDPATGVVRVSFASETDAKYAFAMGQSPTPPAPPVLTPVDHTLVSPPLPSDWTIVVRPPAPGGVVPGFDLSGAVGNSTATAIEVQYWVVPEGADPAIPPAKDAPEWKSAGTWPPTVSTIPIDVEGGRYYWIGLIHIRNQNYSEMTLVGPRLAEKLIAGGISDETRDDIVQDVLGQVDTEIGEGLQAGKDALERSKALGRALIDAAVAALEGDLAEEKSRSTEVQDVLDRIDVFAIADPVARTGILRQQTMLEGVGPSGNETFVQMNTRLVAADTSLGLAVATVLIDAKAYTTDQLALALLTLATKAELASSAAATKLEMESYTDGKVSTAVASLATKSELAGAVAASRLEIETWTNGQISTATAGLITAVGVDDKVSAARLLMEAWTNGQISTATAGLAIASQVAASFAASELLLKTYADDRVSEASATLASKSELASGLSASELSQKTYTDGVVATAVTGLISAAQADAKIATASLTLSGEIDSKVATATASLATVSQVAAAQAAAILSSNTHADAIGNASASQINAVSARGGGQTNIIKNPAAAQGVEFWSGGGVSANSNATIGTFFAANGTIVSATYACSAGQVISLSLNTENQGGGAYINYLPSNTIAQYVPFSGAGWTERKRSTSADPTPPGTTGFQVVIQASGVTYWSRVMANLGPVPNDYRDDAAIPMLRADVAIAMDAAVDAKTMLETARLRLIAAAGGGIPATVELYSDSAGGSFVRIGAKQIGFGDNTTFDDANDTLRTVTGSTRYVHAWGASFGGADRLTYWRGAASVPNGNESKANAMAWDDEDGDSFFGGKTFSGPFDSGPPGGEFDLLVNNTVAIVPSKMMAAEGFSAGEITFDLFVSGAPSNPPDFGFSYAVIAANQDGSGEVALHVGFSSATSNLWQSFSATWTMGTLSTTRGDKKIFLRIGGFGADVRTPRARFGRIRGLYGA